MKTCPTCERTLPGGAFTKNRRRADGLDYQCRECKAARHAAWRAANPDAARARCRQWHRDNKDRSLATGRAGRAANPPAHLAAVARWRAANAEKTRQYRRADYERRTAAYKAASKKRKAILRAAAAALPFTADQLDARMSVFGHRCAYCGGPFEHVDHVIPVSRGGLHCLSNLRPACAPCNLSKGAKRLAEWKAA